MLYVTQEANNYYTQINLKLWDLANQKLLNVVTIPYNTPELISQFKAWSKEFNQPIFTVNHTIGITDLSKLKQAN